jgi:hypothetical protein
MEALQQVIGKTTIKAHKKKEEYPKTVKKELRERKQAKKELKRAQKEQKLTNQINDDEIEQKYQTYKKTHRKAMKAVEEYHKKQTKNIPDKIIN